MYRQSVSLLHLLDYICMIITMNASHLHLGQYDFFLFFIGE